MVLHIVPTTFKQHFTFAIHLLEGFYQPDRPNSPRAPTDGHSPAGVHESLECESASAWRRGLSHVDAALCCCFFLSDAVALFRAKKYTLIRRKHINAASTATAAVATAAAAVTYLIMSTSLLINVIIKASWLHESLQFINIMTNNNHH